MIGRTSKVVLEVVVATLLGLTLVLAAAGWRLAQGPVSLSFLNHEIEAALNARDAPLVFTLQDTILAWGGWERTLDLRAVGVKLLSRDDRRVVASVPEMAVSLSGSALLDRRLAPTTLEVIGARVALERTREGAFRLAMGQRADEAGVRAADDFMDALVGVLTAVPDPERPLSYLRRVSVIDSRVDIVDRMTGTLWGAPDADVILTRQPGGLRVHVATGIDLGGGQAQLAGDVVWKSGGDTIAIDARVSNLSPAQLAGKLPALARAAGVRVPVDGRVTATVAIDGTLREATFRLRGGKGEVEMPELWRHPVAVAGLTARGALRSGPDMLDIEALELDLGGPKITAHGSAIRIGATIALDATAAVRDVPVREAARYWPYSAAEPTRRWFTDNVRDGVLKEARVKLAMHVEDDGKSMGVDALNGTMRFAGGSVAFLDGLPPARGVDATAAFDRDKFVFTFTSGRLEGLRLDSGNARFTGLTGDKEQAAIEVVARGKLAAALALLDRPAFGFSSKLGLKPADVQGDSASRIAISFPLLKALKVDQVSVVAASNLRDVTLPDAVLGQPLSGGELTLRVDRKGMEVRGKAKLGPVPADIAWFANFGGGARFDSRYEVKARLDEAHRKAFDLPFADALAGPVALDLALLEGDGGEGVMQAKLGLKDAAISLPAINWTKPAGTDGVAWLTVEMKNRKPVSISAFEVTSPGLHAKGSARLAEASGAMTVRLDRLVQGATDVSGTVTRQASGALDIDMAGRGFDAAWLMRGMTDGKGGKSMEEAPPIALRARLDQFWFNTGEPVSAVTAALDYDGDKVRSLDFRGSITDRHTIDVALRTDAAGGSFEFRSDNAGRALAVLGLTGNVRGGKLLLTAKRPAGRGNRPWTGKATMTDYQLVNAPALARILTVASLTGINNLLTGQGIAFAGMDLPFVYEKPVITIENARAVGSEIGITGSGTINTTTDIWNVEGTLVPAYTINSMLGNIPILGQLFTGDKGSGVFAATYRVRGKLDDPKAVSVNALAALAPGFLRNLLDVFTGGGKPADAGPAEPAPRRGRDG